MLATEKFDQCVRRAKDNDLYKRKQLADDQRKAAIIGGLLGLRLPEEDLSAAFQDLLSEGCDPVLLEDTVRQMAAYIGYMPVRVGMRALDSACSAKQKTLPDTASAPIWSLTDDQRYAAGTEVYGRLNPTALATIRSAFDASAPDLANLTFRAFGDVYASSRQPLVLRQLATVTALGCLGGVAPQLRFHFGASLNVGVSFVELVETVYIVQFLAGMPAAYNAMVELKAALETQGEPPPYQ